MRNHLYTLAVFAGIAVFAALCHHYPAIVVVGVLLICGFGIYYVVFDCIRVMRRD